MGTRLEQGSLGRLLIRTSAANAVDNGCTDVHNDAVHGQEDEAYEDGVIVMPLDICGTPNNVEHL